MIFENRVNDQQPLILSDCTLFDRLKHYRVNNVYIFKQQRFRKVFEVGNDHLVDNVADKIINIGYFSSVRHADIVVDRMFNLNRSYDLIGYNKGTRYYIFGLSIVEWGAVNPIEMKFKFLKIQKFESDLFN